MADDSDKPKNEKPSGASSENSSAPAKSFYEILASGAHIIQGSLTNQIVGAITHVDLAQKFTAPINEALARQYIKGREITEQRLAQGKRSDDLSGLSSAETEAVRAYQKVHSDLPAKIPYIDRDDLVRQVERNIETKARGAGAASSAEVKGQSDGDGGASARAQKPAEKSNKKDDQEPRGIQPSPTSSATQREVGSKPGHSTSNRDSAGKNSATSSIKDNAPKAFQAGSERTRDGGKEAPRTVPPPNRPAARERDLKARSAKEEGEKGERGDKGDHGERGGKEAAAGKEEKLKDQERRDFSTSAKGEKALVDGHTEPLPADKDASSRRRLPPRPNEPIARELKDQGDKNREILAQRIVPQPNRPARFADQSPAAKSSPAPPLPDQDKSSRALAFRFSMSPADQMAVRQTGDQYLRSQAHAETRAGGRQFIGRAKFLDGANDLSSGNKSGQGLSATDKRSPGQGERWPGLASKLAYLLERNDKHQAESGPSGRPAGLHNLPGRVSAADSTALKLVTDLKALPYGRQFGHPEIVISLGHQSTGAKGHGTASSITTERGETGRQGSFQSHEGIPGPRSHSEASTGHTAAGAKDGTGKSAIDTRGPTGQASGHSTEGGAGAAGDHIHGHDPTQGRHDINDGRKSSTGGAPGPVIGRTPRVVDTKGSELSPFGKDQNDFLDADGVGHAGRHRGGDETVKTYVVKGLMPDKRYITGSELAFVAIMALASASRVRPGEFVSEEGLAKTRREYVLVEEEPWFTPDYLLDQNIRNSSQSRPAPMDRSDGAGGPVRGYGHGKISGEAKVSGEGIVPEEGNVPGQIQGQGLDRGQDTGRPAQEDGRGYASGTEKSATSRRVLLRPQILVQDGDDLCEIAEALFNDRRFGHLIADLNARSIQETHAQDSRVVRLSTRQRLSIPVYQDLIQYEASQSFQKGRGPLITIVETTAIDRELLHDSLSQMLGIDSVNHDPLQKKEIE